MRINYSGQSSIIIVHRWQCRRLEEEKGKGKELEHADSSEVEQQATDTAASTSTERGNLVRMLGEVGSRDRVDPQV